MNINLKKEKNYFAMPQFFPLQVVYGNMLTDPWDHLYLFTVVSHILLTATARSGSQLMLGAIAMPTPSGQRGAIGLRRLAGGEVG